MDFIYKEEVYYNSICYEYYKIKYNYYGNPRFLLDISRFCLATETLSYDDLFNKIKKMGDIKKSRFKNFEKSIVITDYNIKSLLVKILAELFMIIEEERNK